MSDRTERWAEYTRRHRTDNQLQAARRNFGRMIEDHPEEGKRVASFLDRTGLGDHAEVVDYFTRSATPPDAGMLSRLLLYPENKTAEPNRVRSDAPLEERLYPTRRGK